ncbi:MAG: hypothetical protein IPK82_12350 [Polyangiaceae bacterium]|nr:hypothetical protein [Polyangiaceae bacterium]
MRRPLSRMVQALGAVRAPNLDFAMDRADVLRMWGLRLLPRSAAGMWVGREKRAAFLGVTMLLIALSLAISYPVALVALGPLVYGVPHVLSDIRYLIARPGLSQRPLFLASLVIGCSAAFLGLGIRGAFLGAALALVSSRAPAWKKAVGVSFAAAMYALCHWAGFWADLAFVHLHNFVAVGAWLLWRKRTTHLHWAFAGLFLLTCAAITLGVHEPILAHTGGLSAPWTDLSFRELVYTVSPTPDKTWSARLLVLFAFAQAAHYVVWLRLVPEDDRPSAAPRSYRQTYKALVADVGGVVTWAALLTAVAFLVWAVFSIGKARNGYLSFAFFHGHLEIVALCVLWAEKRFPFFASSGVQATSA